MTASTTNPDQTDEPGQPSTMGAESARGIGHQMADVAGAMFGLLLLQRPEAHQDIPRPETPPQPPAESSPPTAIALPEVALPAVELPPQEPAAATQPAPHSIALPASIPMPDLPPDIEPTTGGGLPVPVTVPEAPRSMALLSEIGFLDD